MNKEIWKNINFLNNYYQISNKGNIRHIKSKRINILKPHKDKNGYLIISLYINKKFQTFKLHRLVAQAFIPNPDNLPQVNHKDGNKLNNCVNNLEWCTCRENINHAVKNGYYANRDYSKKFKKVYQYNLDGELVKIWNSIIEASTTLGICASTITKVCKHKDKYKTYKGYIWRYV